MAKVMTTVGSVYIYRIAMQFNVLVDGEYRQVAEVEFGLLDESGQVIPSTFGGPRTDRRVIVIQRSPAPLDSDGIVALLATNKLSNKLATKLQFVAFNVAGLGADPGAEPDV